MEWKAPTTGGTPKIFTTGALSSVLTSLAWCVCLRVPCQPLSKAGQPQQISTRPRSLHRGPLSFQAQAPCSVHPKFANSMRACLSPPERLSRCAPTTSCKVPFPRADLSLWLEVSLKKVSGADHLRILQRSALDASRDPAIGSFQYLSVDQWAIGELLPLAIVACLSHRPIFAAPCESPSRVTFYPVFGGPALCAAR
ncbi:hypothetical protein B0H63DRAFT_159686 [Podospora didyma]|uniref:Uncharacterized protein n=1 Tax=Podospora didyma TaxID=330526 RepID=A0AAE0NTW8_9PEZI|nr:hypothetical protein B0H63DRAFT_159686 [Podospora didyma]